MNCTQEYVDNVKRLVTLAAALLDADRKDAFEYPALHAKSYLSNYEEFIRVKVGLENNEPIEVNNCDLG